MKNHRVSEQLILNAIDQGKQFFELPLEEKMKESKYSRAISQLLMLENRLTFINQLTLKATARCLVKMLIQKTAETYMRALTWAGKMNNPPIGKARWRVWTCGLQGFPVSKNLSSRISGCFVFVKTGDESNWGLCSRAVVKLGLQLFPLFALALDLPEDFFTDKVHTSSGFMPFTYNVASRQRGLQPLCAFFTIHLKRGL